MIEGEKIVLDRVEEKHLPQLLEWRNDPANRKFYREYRVLTIEDKKKWYNDKILNDNSWQFFVVKPREKTDSIIGTVGLTYINFVYGTAEFSITLGDKDYRGRGYGSDMLRTIMKYGFNDLNLNRIWCEVYSNNAAIEIYEKVGFVREGTLRQNVFKDGEYLDSTILSILKDEYYEKYPRK